MRHYQSLACVYQEMRQHFENHKHNQHFPCSLKKQKPINRACTKECSNIGKSTFPSAFALIIEEVVRQKSAKKWQTIRDVNNK